MESAKKDKAALISGIETDARSEEQEIINEAQKQAAEKLKYTEKKIESILNDAKQQAKEKAETARKKVLSSMELEAKRISMHVQYEVMNYITEQVEKKLYSMTSEPGYESILQKFIIEAAVGLDTESAFVNASEKERELVNEKLISRVCEKIRGLVNKEIKLVLSDEPPLKSQGVILTAADGHTAYNNQIKTRISRNQRKIRSLIYDTIFADTKKDKP